MSISVNFVEGEFRKEGYVPLLQMYKNNITKFEARCPVGHMYITTWKSWKSGVRCYCITKRNKKYTIEEVTKYLLKFKYCLVGAVYKNANSPLKLICHKNHTITTTFSDFIKGQRCKHCNGHADQNEILAELKNNYSVLSYGGYLGRSIVRCNRCNHEKDICIREWYRTRKICKNCTKSKPKEKLNPILTYQKRLERKNFQLIECENGSYTIRCPYAHITTVTSMKANCSDCRSYKTPSNKIEEELKKHGCSSISTYRGASKPMQVKCNNGHQYTTSMSSFRRGYRCVKCKEKNQVNVRKEALNRGHLMLTDYTGFHKAITFKCQECSHVFNTSYDNFFCKGSGCTKCRLNSKEKNILKFLKNFGEVEIFNRSVITPYELDFYLPSFNLAIEHSGLYWHSEKFRDKNYHLDKLQLCQNKSIQLIQIFGDEWTNRKEQVKNFIESKLGVNQKLYARACTFKVVDSKDARKFLDDYHIQGSVLASFYFGIFYQNELVQVMSFGKHHRQNSKDYLLSRLCTKRGLQVVGGASKLLKNAVERMNIDHISTFADLRYSEGAVYQALGFKEVSRSKPDYSYIKNDYRFSKQSLKKTEIEKLCNKTEKKLRSEQGYLRIYDCGKIKYRWFSSSHKLSNNPLKIKNNL